MLKIFLSSHGSMASGMQSSLKILMGECENLTVFDAYLDESCVHSMRLSGRRTKCCCAATFTAAA